MGHSRNEDTNDLYSHIELPLLREAIGKLEAWHTQQLKPPEKEGNGKADGRATDRSDAGTHAEKISVAGDLGTGSRQGDTATEFPARIQ
jgi:hypothetical protein